jgi:hypothetical protein
MSRIQLTDTGMSAAMKMSGGNPGALRVLVECLTSSAAIDPDSMFGGIAPIFDLDTLGIYGSRIWMLFKDVCDEDLRVMCAILRANQLGFLPEAKLNHAIDNYGEGIDVPALVAQVEKRLPAFQRAPQPPDMCDGCGCKAELLLPGEKCYVCGYRKPITGVSAPSSPAPVSPASPESSPPVAPASEGRPV